jgi:RNA polymerase sigma-70 factor (TIGR02957 family)
MTAKERQVTQDTTATETFQAHRELLAAMAYQLLGSSAEAEDVVQETWLRWDRSDRERIENPRSWLVRVATRLALDRLRSARARRERYVGPWLPEPLLTSPDIAEDVERAEAVSMAMLVVLETLSPLERAVFVLREAFGFSYADIAGALDRSEQSVRQLAHRARDHVQARRPRFRLERGVRQRVTERFLAASLGGDIEELLRVLSPEVTLVADGGGEVAAARRPIHGASKVALLLAAIAGGAVDARVELVDVNGGPAAVLSAAGAGTAVVLVDVDADERVRTVYIVANPEKLTGFGPPTSPGTS